MRANEMPTGLSPEEMQAWADSRHDDARPSLSERFATGLTTFTDAEMEAAKQPHPHAFQHDDCGLFPVGEVTVVGAPGREGKTRSMMAVAVSYVLGTKPAGLVPQPERSVLIYSAEDSRDQYARLVVSHCSQLGAKDAATVRERIIVPDLTTEGMEAFATLVAVAERRPIESIAVGAVIQALQARMAQPLPPGLVIFETASTLSEAEEDNTAFRVMIRALRRIAREVEVAVVLIHHTSQAAGNNLASLDISVADIRGATSLVNNARQCHLLVNLGSDDEPYPDNDARTVLRRMAAPHAHGRVTALICLDSSKGIDPPPLFLHWRASAYGPALYVTPPPVAIEGARWRKVHQMIRGERADRRDAKRDEAKAAKVSKVVEVVRRLDAEGKHPTARAVSIAAGCNPGWAAPFLAMATDDGDLVCKQEQVPRTRGMTPVYRPADPLEESGGFNG